MYWTNPVEVANLFEANPSHHCHPPCQTVLCHQRTLVWNFTDVCPGHLQRLGTRLVLKLILVEHHWSQTSMLNFDHLHRLSVSVRSTTLLSNRKPFHHSHELQFCSTVSGGVPYQRPLQSLGMTSILLCSSRHFVTESKNCRRLLRQDPPFLKPC